jgi:hypothetical protein
MFAEGAYSRSPYRATNYSDAAEACSTSATTSSGDHGPQRAIASFTGRRGHEHGLERVPIAAGVCVCAAAQDPLGRLGKYGNFSVVWSAPESERRLGSLRDSCLFCILYRDWRKNSACVSFGFFVYSSWRTRQSGCSSAEHRSEQATTGGKRIDFGIGINHKA